MPSKKRKKKQPPTVVSVASAYNEGIGLEGLKKKRVSATSNMPFELPVDEQEERRRQDRIKRFVEHNQKKSRKTAIDEILYSEPHAYSKSKPDDVLATKNEFVGRSTVLEKPYMRLTAAPKAEDVRPLAVLRKSLAHVKAHYIQNEDFEFANEQLKSIRQDITVQHLRNSFVLEVYETHSRILLENGDLNEFNQCQTMIQSLTSPSHSIPWEDVSENALQAELRNSMRKKGGKRDVLVQSEEAADEFGAYSLLYDIVQNSWCDLIIHFASIKKRIDGKAQSVKKSKKSKTVPPITHGSSVRHAWNVVRSIMHDDYIAFFRLYESAPHMSAYLMDFLVRRVRNMAYVRIIAAYRPTISTESFREALSFRDLEETRQFLKKKGAIFLNDKQGDPPFWVDCKSTYSVYVESVK